MRDPARIDRILGLLREKWKEVPDQRFFQFLENNFSGSGLEVGIPLYFTEDTELEEWLKGANGIEE